MSYKGIKISFIKDLGLSVSVVGYDIDRVSRSIIIPKPCDLKVGDIFSCSVKFLNSNGIVHKVATEIIKH